MIEVVGSFWDHPGTDLFVIPTNGIVKANGEAVMGAGVALQATHRYPGIAATLGGMIQCRGNRVNLIGYSPPVASFPTKHHWRHPADADLIARSAAELVRLVDGCGYRTVALPRVGCGAGGLRWEIVRPILNRVFNDRFIVAAGP